MIDLFDAKKAYNTYFNVINKETIERIEELLENESNKIALDIFQEEVYYNAKNKKRSFFINSESELGKLFYNTDIINIIGLMDYKVSIVKDYDTYEKVLLGWNVSF